MGEVFTRMRCKSERRSCLSLAIVCSWGSTSPDDSRSSPSAPSRPVMVRRWPRSSWKAILIDVKSGGVIATKDATCQPAVEETGRILVLVEPARLIGHRELDMDRVVRAASGQHGTLGGADDVIRRGNDGVGIDAGSVVANCRERFEAGHRPYLAHGAEALLRGSGNDLAS